ncbi:MAG: glycosyltransferase family 1 protein [Candidatus Micrarchaeaceae archaeon]
MRRINSLQIFVASILTLKNYSGIPIYIYNILDNIDLNYRKLFKLVVPFEFDIPAPDFDNTYEFIELNARKTNSYINKFNRLKFRLLGQASVSKINHYQPDVYWAPAFTVPRFLNKQVKVIPVIHDLIPLKYGNIFGSDVKFKFLKRQSMISTIKYSIKRADKILTISESVANELKDLFKINKEIEIASPAYNKKLFKPILNAKELFYQKYKIYDKFVLIGNMKSQRKNFEDVIDSFKRIDTKGLLCVFGSLSKSQIELANLRLGDKFKHLGYVDENDLPIIYSAANAFIALSKAEGFDLPSLEARVCGTIVISSDIPVHHEVLENESEYFRIGDNDRLSRLIYDVLSADKTFISSKILNKYDWGKTADKTLKFLTS